MKLQTTALLLLLANLAFTQPELDKKLQDVQQNLTQMDAERENILAKISGLKLQVIQRDLKAQGLPIPLAGGEVIWHPAHALEYSEKHEQSRWVAHIITPDIKESQLARLDSFKVDTQVKSGTAVTADYWYSGYDRGHLVPSADMRWNFDAMAATYLYSNISPQLPELNREQWAELEDWVRRYVNFGGERVFAVTGPVLEDGLPTMENEGRKNEVSIPKQFYKVIADLDGEDKKGIAFLMNNGVNDQAVVSYAVSIDEVEVTGIDFFPALDDATEAKIEAQRNIKDWYAEGDPHFGETEPMSPPLPRGYFNTTQAKHHVGNVISVCGTVVSTRKTKKSNAVYLNLDRMYPHQDFYATLWDQNGPNFSYNVETELIDKKICVTGKVTRFNEIARISINNETEIELWEDVKK